MYRRLRVSEKCEQVMRPLWYDQCWKLPKIILTNQNVLYTRKNEFESEFSWLFHMNYVVVFVAARLKAKAQEIEHYAKLEADNMVLHFIIV